MEHLIKVPPVAESVTEVRISKWLKPDGAAVKVGEVLLELETDKASVEIVAENAGALMHMEAEGKTLPIGALVAKIDDSKAGTASASALAAASSPAAASAAQAPASAQRPPSPEKSSSANEGPHARVSREEALKELTSEAAKISGRFSPAPAPSSSLNTGSPANNDKPGDRRVPMTRIRAKIAERLVQAQHTAAILTTFNEADMGPIMKIRSAHKDAFKSRNGVPLSFMSFFTRGCVLALREFPAVNASMDGKDVVYHDYADIGIAVGTDRGLVVPVLRGAEKMSFAEIEKTIGNFATKARDNKLSIQDMMGGTFTISNGGVYGSLLSTPILNPPQSGILGMHKIQERPIAVEGRVEIRSMMYLALSYDHRIIDGKEAVSFLVSLKDYLEKPEKLGMEFLNG